MAALMPVMMLVMNFTTIAIIWFGGIRVDAGKMQIGNLMAFLQYAMQIMFSLMMASMMFVMIPRAQASRTESTKCWQLSRRLSDAPQVRSADCDKGYLEFKKVSFRYPGAEEPVLSNISFTARPGEVTAIIGGTGSGKSTLINLIPRFYDVEAAAFLWTEWTSGNWPRSTCEVKSVLCRRKRFLFTGTIADNIRYGKEDATDEEVRRAAEIAQATEFIAEMKDGFDSMIAQGGTNVSGGQKQRLSIARALVRKPKIFIFDDSFSALDFKTDAKLRAALKKETADATVMIVAPDESVR